MYKLNIPSWTVCCASSYFNFTCSEKEKYLDLHIING